MPFQHSCTAARPPAPSAMILSDNLISLAEQADQAGLAATARDLLRLACTVFDEAVAARQRRSLSA